MQRILIVEDDRHISEGLKLNLELQGYAVDIAADGVILEDSREGTRWHYADS